jgi:predicted transcriptional regulator with HTH domain
MSRPELERALLEVLMDVSPRLMPELAALGEVRLAVVPEPTLTDVVGCLVGLERRGQAVGVTTDDGRRWGITAQGRARLAE